MKNYGVKELARLSGISVRTLHYYDNIGLLKPSYRSEAGYRYYGEKELFRLQQILFYKKLDFQLKEIQSLLDEPDFDPLKALENHKEALLARQKQIETLLKTIDKTIIHLKEGKTMKNPKMLYEGLPKEVGTTYRKEAIETYGKESVEHSEKSLMKLGKEGFKQLQVDFENVNKELFDLKNMPPESAEVQSLIAKHYEMIRKFWGTSNLEDKQAEAYAGLGQLYVSDERFTTMDGKPQPRFAKFLEKAMIYYAENSLK